MRLFRSRTGLKALDQELASFPDAFFLPYPIPFHNKEFLPVPSSIQCSNKLPFSRLPLHWQWSRFHILHELFNERHSYRHKPLTCLRKFPDLLIKGEERRKVTHDAGDLRIYPTPASRMRGSDSVTLEDRSLSCFVSARLLNWVSSSLIRSWSKDLRNLAVMTQQSTSPWVL